MGVRTGRRTRLQHARPLCRNQRLEPHRHRDERGHEDLEKRWRFRGAHRRERANIPLLRDRALHLKGRP